MYKQFAFEGEIHQSLSCVPLAVRRKLDLAGLKISLAGWQALTRPERLALCHLPVDGSGALAVYREVMRGFCDRHAVALGALPAVADQDRPWDTRQVPASVTARLVEAGGALAEARWQALDEESRYGLLKMAEPKQALVKFQALLAELGLSPALEAKDAQAAQSCERAD